MAKERIWWRAQPESSDTAEVVMWMRDHFIKSFVNETNPRYWPVENDKGAFAITLLTLTYCTAAAGLVNGTSDASSSQSIYFISSYFADAPKPSGNRYAIRAAALYSLFRHGLVHQRVPGKLDLEDGRTLGWVLGRENDRPRHLEIWAPTTYSTKTTLSDGHFRLSVQPDVLFDDCLRVFQTLQGACSEDQALAEKVYEGAIQAVAARKLKQGRSKAAILAQLRDAVDSPDLGGKA